MKLFVYGTLRRGERAHRLLGGAPLVAHGRTEPRFRLVDMGGYPALVEGGATAVAGEIYDVADARVPELDRFEEVPELYQRVLLPIGDYVAWAYVLPAALAGERPELPHGDWCARGRRGRSE